jgi:ABC-2 type transport system permease protein
MNASLRRLRALVRKESRQMWRDPSTILMGVVLPMMMLLLFGYGLTLDIHDVPVALVAEKPSPQTAEIAACFSLSTHFKPISLTSMQVAERMMLDREIDAIVVLRGDFSRLSCLGEGRTMILVRGTDANRARIIEAHAQGALSMWSMRRAAMDLSGAGGPVVVENRMWYNEDSDSRHFLVPGLMVIIMTLTGAFLTAMVVAREWERGTFEALFVTPVKSWEILVGKAVPYFCLGMAGLLLCVVAARVLFGVPLRGSPLVLLGGSMLYLLLAVGMGLLISALTRNQFLASQLALISSFLPATLLSGFLFDLRSMPGAIEAFTRIIPARYYVTFVKTVFLTGDVWTIVLRTCSIMGAVAVLFIFLAQAKTKKSLDRR